MESFGCRGDIHDQCCWGCNSKTAYLENPARRVNICEQDNGKFLLRLSEKGYELQQKEEGRKPTQQSRKKIENTCDINK